MCLAVGTKMQWVSSVGNKGQTKPEFLVSKFRLCKGNSVHLLFNRQAVRKKSQEWILITSSIYAYIS